MVIFVLTVVVSKLTVKVKRLTQEIAMFEEEMKKKLQAKKTVNRGKRVFT